MSVSLINNKFKPLIIYCLISCFSFFIMNTATGQENNRAIDSLNQLLSNTSNDSLKIEYYLALSHEVGINKDVIPYLKKAIALNERKKVNYRKHIEALFLLGVKDNLEESQQYYETAYNLAIKHQCYEELMTVAFRYGWNEALYFNTEKGFKILEKAIEIGEAQKLDDQLISLYERMGALFIHFRQIKQGVVFFQKGISLGEKLIAQQEVKFSVQFNLAVLLKNMSVEYLTEGKIDSASVSISRAINIITSNSGILRKKHYYSLAHMHTKYCNILMIKKQYESAQAHIDTAIMISQQINNPRILEAALFRQAKLYLELKSYKACIQSGEKVLQLGLVRTKSTLTNSISFGTYNTLCECYAKAGNIKAVLMAKDSLLAAKEKHYEKERIKIAQKLDTEYQVKELQNQKDQQVAKLKARNQLLWIFGIIAVLFSILSSILYRINRQRKQLARTLEVKNEALQKMDKAKTRFFSNVSHELKTPLTLIINPIRRLLQSKKTADEDYYLMKSVEKNSLQLFDLTQQILELTKFEFNKVEVRTTAIHFEKSLRKLFGEFESFAAARQIDFQFTFQGTPNLIILIDHYKLITVVKNLISNALKFTPENGKVQVLVAEKEAALEIIVEDTGRGIHENDLTHIFDRYYQAKITNTFIEGGTGIGLAICKEYANILGGTITVHSTYGEGSRFIVRFPKKIASLSEQHLFSPIANAQQDNSLPLKASNPSLGLPTILLVEDNLDLQEYLQLILQPSFNVIIAQHGQAALDILAQQKENIQLIVSDVMMPVMNGYQFLEEVKAIPQYAAIPIVMLTALSETTDKLKALRLGVDDYIMKPFVDEELLARIDNLIEHANQRKEYQANEIQEISNVTTVPVSSSTPTLSSPIAAAKVSKTDLEWMKTLEATIIEHHGSFSFSADQLVDHMMMSRALLFRKVKKLIGLTPRQYIKEIRLLQARKLLEENPEGTVKSVVYSVGLKDTRNFSKNFHKRFGKYPSEYLN